MGARLRRLLVAATSLLAGCTGLFQRALPDQPDQYHVVAPVRDDLCIGSAAVDITPPVGGYLGGFGLGRTSTAVHAPLQVRALVLTTDSRRFAILGIDNLGVMRDDVDWLKSGLPGFAMGDVFVCSSHTHAGPDLIGLWGSYLLTTGRDRDRVAQLRAATTAAVQQALAAAAPAQLLRGEARLPPTGLVKNSKRPQVFDRRVVVLHARARDDGRPLGTLLQLVCHPEVLGRDHTELSPDFVGALCEQWQARGHGQAVFVNGALGAMVSPAVQPRDATGVAKFGAVACTLAEQALASAKPLAVDAIEVRRADLYLPVETLGFRLGQLTMALQRQLYDGCARSSVGWLRIGDFEAVAVPGELEPTLAQRLRAELHRPDLVVFGLCDDELGYLLDERDARNPRFGYERSMSVCLRAGELVRAALSGRTAPAASR
ncbi:MAG: hypothetical protein JNK49_03340 [Planctomycetes bacterium]|nr:hypothetical protein [Planctomycetota bacterium]